MASAACKTAHLPGEAVCGVCADLLSQYCTVGNDRIDIKVLLAKSPRHPEPHSVLLEQAVVKETVARHRVARYQREVRCLRECSNRISRRWGTPNLLRPNTERPIARGIGTNVLVGTGPQRSLHEANSILDGHTRPGAIPEKWDGHTAERIVCVALHENASRRMVRVTWVVKPDQETGVEDDHRRSPYTISSICMLSCSLPGG